MGAAARGGGGRWGVEGGWADIVWENRQVAPLRQFPRRKKVQGGAELVSCGLGLERAISAEESATVTIFVPGAP